MRHRFPLELSLHRVPSIESHKIKFSGQKVQIGRQHLFQTQLFVTVIFDDGTARDNIIFRKYAVQQPHRKLCRVICQDNLQRLRFLFIGIHCRNTGQGVLAVTDLMRLVTQVTSDRSVFIFQHKCRGPEVAHAARRILLRQRVIRIFPVIAGIINIAGCPPVRVSQQKVHPPHGFCAIVQMQQYTIPVNLQLVSRMRGIQGKSFCFRIEKNRICHSCSPPTRVTLI